MILKVVFHKEKITKQVSFPAGTKIPDAIAILQKKLSLMTGSQRNGNYGIFNPGQNVVLENHKTLEEYNLKNQDIIEFKEILWEKGESHLAVKNEKFVKIQFEGTNLPVQYGFQETVDTIINKFLQLLLFKPNCDVSQYSLCTETSLILKKNKTLFSYQRNDYEQLFFRKLKIMHVKASLGNYRTKKSFFDENTKNLNLEVSIDPDAQVISLRDKLRALLTTEIIDNTDKNGNRLFEDFHIWLTKGAPIRLDYNRTLSSYKLLDSDILEFRREIKSTKGVVVTVKSMTLSLSSNFEFGSNNLINQIYRKFVIKNNVQNPENYALHQRGQNGRLVALDGRKIVATLNPEPLQFEPRDPKAEIYQFVASSQKFTVSEDDKQKLPGLISKLIGVETNTENGEIKDESFNLDLDSEDEIDDDMMAELAENAKNFILTGNKKKGLSDTKNEETKRSEYIENPLANSFNSTQNNQIENVLTKEITDPKNEPKKFQTTEDLDDLIMMEELNEKPKESFALDLNSDDEMDGSMLNALDEIGQKNDENKKERTSSAVLSMLQSASSFTETVQVEEKKKENNNSDDWDFMTNEINSLKKEQENFDSNAISQIAQAITLTAPKIQQENEFDFEMPEILPDVGVLDMLSVADSMQNTNPENNLNKNGLSSSELDDFDSITQELQGLI